MTPGAGTAQSDGRIAAAPANGTAGLPGVINGALRFHAECEAAPGQATAKIPRLFTRFPLICTIFALN